MLFHKYFIKSFPKKDFSVINLHKMENKTDRNLHVEQNMGTEHKTGIELGQHADYYP